MQEGDEAQSRRRQSQAALLGRPLDGLSVEDLRSYISALQVEIARVEHTIGTRQSVRHAADAVFGRRDG